MTPRRCALWSAGFASENLYSPLTMPSSTPCSRVKKFMKSAWQRYTMPIYQCDNLLQSVSRPEANHKTFISCKACFGCHDHWHVCAGLPSCLGLFRHGHVLVVGGNIVDDVLVLGQPPRRLRMNPQNQNNCPCWKSITFASSVRPPPTSLSLHFQWLRPFHNRRQDRSPSLPEAQRQWTLHVQVNSRMPERFEEGSLRYPNTWKRGQDFLNTSWRCTER